MTHRLYLELLFVGLVFLSIMLINNLFLYKQKLKDKISFMLIAGIATNVFEIIWTIFEDNEGLWMITITYVAISCYAVSFLIFTALLSMYILDNIGLKPGKKVIAIAYIIPIAAYGICCITTPWTHVVVWLDSKGHVNEGFMLGTVFYIWLFIYVFFPLFQAIYYVTIGKNRRKENSKITFSLFVFGIMIPILYFLEFSFIGGDSESYQIVSLPISIALVYLITNISTHTVLENRAKVEAVETDLRIATKIQMDALPPVAPEFKEHLDINLRCSMDTAKEVGGDFYDYFTLDENRICFLIADVSGKGTPAALFMMTAKTMIKDYAMTMESTSEIFNAVNARLSENNEAGMFATAWIGIVDTRTMMLQYTNAGHNYPIFKRSGEPCEEMRTVHGLFLAGFEYTQYKQSEIQLKPGDRLFLYTDGITEAHDKENALYGTERLIQVLEDTKDAGGEEALDSILADVNEFAHGAPQFDDMTMLVLTIKG